jgi:nucleoside-diphosphate-sugar epimerase
MGVVARVARERFDCHCPARFVAMPAGPARWAARVAEAVAPGSPLTLGLVLSGSVRHRFSSRRAARELGYRPRQSLEDAIAECIAFNRRLREETRT